MNSYFYLPYIAISTIIGTNLAENMTTTDSMLTFTTGLVLANVVVFCGMVKSA